MQIWSMSKLWRWGSEACRNFENLVSCIRPAGGSGVQQWTCVVFNLHKCESANSLYTVSYRHEHSIHVLNKWHSFCWNISLVEFPQNLHCFSRMTSSPLSKGWSAQGRRWYFLYCSLVAVLSYRHWLQNPLALWRWNTLRAAQSSSRAPQIMPLHRWRRMCWALLLFGNFRLLCSSTLLTFQDAIKDGLRAVQNCVEDEAKRLNADRIVDSDWAELGSNVVRKALIFFCCRLDMFAFENFTIPPLLAQRPVGNCAWRRSIRGPVCCIGVEQEKNMRSSKSSTTELQRLQRRCCASILTFDRKKRLTRKGRFYSMQLAPLRLLHTCTWNSSSAQWMENHVLEWRSLERHC